MLLLPHDTRSTRNYERYSVRIILHSSEQLLGQATAPAKAYGSRTHKTVFTNNLPMRAAPIKRRCCRDPQQR